MTDYTTRTNNLEGKTEGNERLFTSFKPRIDHKSVKKNILESCFAD
jgi:hypothetical protein